MHLVTRFSEVVPYTTIQRRPRFQFPLSEPAGRSQSSSPDSIGISRKTSDGLYSSNSPDLWVLNLVDRDQRRTTKIHPIFTTTKLYCRAHFLFGVMLACSMGLFVEINVLITGDHCESSLLVIALPSLTFGDRLTV
jgi:hypothetical protein